MSSHKAVVSGDGVYHTGSSVGTLCVVVEDLPERRIRVRGILDEGKRFGVEEEEVFRK